MSLAKQICVALLALSLGLIGTVLPAMAQESPRKIVSLSDGWRFRYGDAPEAVTAAGFDDSGWETVSVPHTWNRIGEYALERSAATNNKQGVGWYRLSYTAPLSTKGRRQYLDFAAVAIIADVWVNGVHVGQHKGAFSRFRFDVTAAWKPGAANLIVVKADNSKPAPGSSTENVLPLAGDFFIHGGIYRGVSLIEANDVGIDLLDFGGPGVYVRAKANEQRLAKVEITSVIRHFRKLPMREIVSVVVKDSAGNVVASKPFVRIVDHMQPPDEIRPAPICGYFENGIHLYRPCGKPERVKPTSWTSTAIAIIDLPNPRRWNGGADPSLYVATINVFEGRQLVDTITQSFGIRDFKFDPNTGFSLNGKPLKLHGVSRHQDRMGQGYALTRADHKQDMDLIAEMGANAVRMAHYQHDDAWADEADAHGMIAWAEVPFVTTPSFTGGEGSPELFANAEQQTRELIRQMYNHPSIMMWSVGNEVDAATSFGASKEPVKPLKLLQHIARIARQEDPSRPTVFADCCEDMKLSPLASEANKEEKDNGLAGTTDLIGYNRYYGWYYPLPPKATGFAEAFAAKMDGYHAKHPTIPISISEYGAGGAVTQHSDDIMSGFINPIGRPQPEEYESWLHEQSWPVIAKRDYIWGSFAWNMFDFASDLRGEGDSVDINTKGLVTFDRKTKKDAFYYYQANWSDKPMIHLTGKRYMDRPYSVIDVKAYTTAPRASLVAEGRNVGTVDCPDHVCVWRDVPLKPGANTFTASAVVEGLTYPDSAIWNGPDPARDGIHLDVGDIAGRVLPVAPAEAGASGVKSALSSFEAPASAGATRRFGSDNFVTGGTPAVLNMGGFGGRTSGGKKTVAAPDPALYDYWREGDAFSYAIPVADGKWTVTIHSFEPRASGSGTMTVAANGKVAVPAFSVKDAAGGALKGLAKSFPVVVKGGILKLDFTGVGGKAVVAAIEVTR